MHEKENPETRISFDGFSCDESILLRVREEIGDVDEITSVAYTGSIPNGINSATVLAFLKELKAKNAKIVIDSRSVSFAELTKFKPWLIKPNKDEAETCTGRKLDTIEDVASLTKELYESGIENVMISLGGGGAVLACKQGVFYAKTPKIDVRSTIGAGDSTLAGFMDATAKGFNIENVLKRAMAYGVSACMQEGTLPPMPIDVMKMQEKVEIFKLF